MIRWPSRRAMKLRGLWMSIHKWIGLLLAVLIIPISLTGSALVWHDWVDEAVNPQRFDGEEQRAGADPVRLCRRRPGRARARRADRAAALSRAWRGADPCLRRRARCSPASSPRTRTNVWLDPADGRVLDKAGSGDGLVMVMHVLHGNLMWPGWGRTIVGWVGVFMFVSCLTGIWLWWPITGSVRRGFRWRRQNSTNANLHHQMGFWIMVPLAILSFTGFWISFPSVFGMFEPAATQQKGPPPNREAAMRARPLERTAMTPEAAIAAAQPHATGAIVSITWPTDQAPEWRIAYEREGGPAEVDGRRRLGRGHAAASAAPGNPRPLHAPPARRHRHGPGVADRHLHRRHHPGFARDHRHRDVAEEPWLARGAGQETQGQADAAAGRIVSVGSAAAASRPSA